MARKKKCWIRKESPHLLNAFSVTHRRADKKISAGEDSLDSDLGQSSRV